jgi:hypothetical protein
MLMGRAIAMIVVGVIKAVSGAEEQARDRKDGGEDE